MDVDCLVKTCGSFNKDTTITKRLEYCNWVINKRTLLHKIASYLAFGNDIDDMMTASWPMQSSPYLSLVFP